MSEHSEFRRIPSIFEVSSLAPSEGSGWYPEGAVVLAESILVWKLNTTLSRGSYLIDEQVVLQNLDLFCLFLFDFTKAD